MPQRRETTKESGTEKMRLRTVTRAVGDRWEARVYVLIDGQGWVEAWKRRSRSREALDLLASGFRRRLLESTLSVSSLLHALRRR